MAQYNLAIPSFRIHDTRSLRKDTLVGSMSLTAHNAQGGLHHDWPNQTVNLGDHEKETTVQTNLLSQDVDVPDPTPSSPDGGSIAWGFLLVNKGHPDSQFVGILKKGVDGIVGGLAGNVVGKGQGLGLTLGNLEAMAAALGIQKLFELLTADCDGNVAVLGLSLTAAEVAQMTADPNNSLDSILCPGTDSPGGCGSNSKYTVNYSMINTTSLINTVIDLNGRWTDGSTRSAVISAALNLLTVDMSAYHRPAAHGPIVDSSTITLTFPDDATFTGKLQLPNMIRWSNGSAWTKM
jgi:hypothetical protein